MIDTFVRALRGVIRSPIRSLLVVILLAACLSFALAALALSFAAGDELDKIKQTTGTEGGLSINPSQFQNAIQKELNRSVTAGVPFDSNNVGRNITPLTMEQADAIESLPYVTRVEVFTIAPVEYEFSDRDTNRPENDFRTPIGDISLPDAVLTGSRDSVLLTDFLTGAKRLEQGRLFGPEDAGKDVLVIDQDTATLEALQLGDKIVLKTQVLPDDGEQTPAEPQVHQVEAEIIGVYADLEAATQGFTPARIEAWYGPIDMVRKLQEPDDQDLLSAISFTYDSVDRAPQLREDIQSLGDPKLFTITTTEKRYEDISDPVKTMRGTTLLVTVAGLAVVGLIMVMLMALVVRGRLREIGILKAVGARNRHVILQFAAETVGIAVVAVLIAVPTVVITSDPLADLLRPDATAERRSAGTQGGPDLGAGARALTSAPVIDDPVRTEERRAVLEQVDATVSSQIIVLAAAIAVGLGLLGALVPIVAVMRLRPAEVLRLEA